MYGITFKACNVGHWIYLYYLVLKIECFNAKLGYFLTSYGIGHLCCFI
jgi:hypothetical protein